MCEAELLYFIKILGKDGHLGFAVLQLKSFQLAFHFLSPSVIVLHIFKLSLFFKCCCFKLLELQLPRYQFFHDMGFSEY